MSNTNYKLNSIIILKGKIESVTGLHIGGNADKIEIGGVDSPVIRDPRTLLPYIPGSSLKGKIRTLLEYALSCVKNDGGPSNDEKITSLFGEGVNDAKNKTEISFSRLIFRDAYPDEETINMWKELNTPLLYTELKSENTINRLTSAANPRQIERVVAESKFNFEILYLNFYQDQQKQLKKEHIDKLLLGLKLLELNYIGKSGSRGYGKVKIHLFDPIIELHINDILSNNDNYQNYINFNNNLTENLKSINSVSYNSVS